MRASRAAAQRVEREALDHLAGVERLGDVVVGTEARATQDVARCAVLAVSITIAIWRPCSVWRSSASTSKPSFTGIITSSTIAVRAARRSGERERLPAVLAPRGRSQPSSSSDRAQHVPDRGVVVDDQRPQPVPRQLRHRRHSTTPAVTGLRCANVSAVRIRSDQRHRSTRRPSELWAAMVERRPVPGVVALAPPLRRVRAWRAATCGPPPCSRRSPTASPSTSSSPRSTRRGSSRSTSPATSRAPLASRCHRHRTAPSSTSPPSSRPRTRSSAPSQVAPRSPGTARWVLDTGLEQFRARPRQPHDRRVQATPREWSRSGRMPRTAPMGVSRVGGEVADPRRPGRAQRCHVRRDHRQVPWAEPVTRGGCCVNAPRALVEPEKGIEPLTFSLRVRCSAD